MKASLLSLHRNPFASATSLLRRHAGRHARCGYAALALAGAAGLALPAQALTFLAPLDFTAATQSMWGPDGGVLQFGAADSFGIGPFTFAYDIGASTGSVAASFNGDLRVNYSPLLEGPTTTRLGLDFRGDAGGGQLASYLGAWARIRVAGINALNQDYALDINTTFTPHIAQPVGASDSFAAASVGVDVYVAEAGVELALEQNDTFQVNAINGRMAYSLRGSGIVNYAPFSIGSDSGIAVDVALTDYGLWDFRVADITLDSRFAPDFDVNLVIYEEHIDGIRFCQKCLWFICVPIPCGISYDRNEQELVGIDVYSGTPFALAFNEIDPSGGFTIAVVPEPSGIALLVVGLGSLAAARRRRA